jgi:hypothetical protein
MIYELRVYVAQPGMTEELHQRFREHTLEIFARLGIEIVGFWTRKDDPSILTYLCRFRDTESRDAAWSALEHDGAWREIKRRSEANGPLTAQMTSVLLEPVDYWTEGWLCGEPSEPSRVTSDRGGEGD